MANKMLIDATHPEETRVVVLRGNRVEEFDFESANRRQLRGNIYLAKVTRVEPSLQAAFVDYGGNRHGFLAFSEIHPDYYQIPVADRQALIDEEERAHRDAEEEADRRAGMRRNPPRHRSAARKSESVSADLAASGYGEHQPSTGHGFEGGASGDFEHGETPSGDQSSDTASDAAADAGANQDETDAAGHESHRAVDEAPVEAEVDDFDTDESEPPAHAEAPALAGDTAHHEASAGRGRDTGRDDGETRHDDDNGNGNGDSHDGEEEEIVESVGGADAMEEVPDRTPRYRRQYKIQEVIKRRQIMLVQVVKEERGTKGAALTTYLSLAGRYSVLMPNTARGGGISRKITSVQDRKRLKDVAEELEVPEGMGVILRTAGASRTKTEIKRDFEYLLRAWETVRDLTLNSTAPTLVYEEGSLVKRSIRDLYNKDIDEVIVAGDAAYRDARDFMRMLMPSHAKNVKLFQDSQPLLTRYGIESQLDAMFSPVVQLRSGGYIVLNQTEALVAIDVNSGRATREHHIEDTALKTNVEASEEIARQLRLRDLAGLIVIDFIDMDEKRNNRSVERRLKDCLKNDRARIQVGRISHFGLLEMSRQRIRSSVLESSTDKCPHCGGTGHVRSVSSVALQCLRMIEEALQRGATHNIIARTRSDIALYVLNHKRAHLHDLESRFQITITVSADAAISGQQPFVIEKGEQVHSLEQARALAAQATSIPIVDHSDDDIEEPVEEVEVDIDEGEDTELIETEVAATDDHGEPAERGENGEIGENGEPGRRRRRRRRRGRRGEGREGGLAPGGGEAVAGAEQPDVELGNGYGSDFVPKRHDEPAHDASGDADENGDGEAVEETAGTSQPHPNGNGEAERRRRRRGRRGGRRNRREDGEANLHPPEYGVTPIDEEIAHAVADFGGPPPEEVPSSIGDYAPAHAPVPVPVAAPEAAVTSEPAAAANTEPPRRRSTVREPAPFLVGAAPARSATPVEAEPQTNVDAETTPSHAMPLHGAPGETAAAPLADIAATPAEPRRAGWWAKRFFGDKR